MRDAGVGSVLVASSNYPHGLVGIFTERDLLRWIEDIQQGNYWQKTVAYVMSHPLITIDVSEMENAGEIMMRKNLRHLPVTYKDKAGIEQLAGVISMRDLFRTLMRKEIRRREVRQIALRKESLIRVGLIAAETPALRALIAQNEQIIVTELKAKDADLKGLRGLVLDLDGLPPADWAQLLSRVEHDALPAAMVVFTPHLHEAKHVEVIRKLGASSDKFKVFMKPLSLLQVLREFRRWTRAG
jgi:CBS domain-containing protein